MENHFRILNDRFKVVKKRVFEESKLKFPSVDSLERAGEELIRLLKESQIENEKFNTWAYREKRKLDIFIVDLPGELTHDYERRNQRYHDRWSSQQRKLNEMISDFEVTFNEDIQENLNKI